MLARARKSNQANLFPLTDDVREVFHAEFIERQRFGLEQNLDARERRKHFLFCLDALQLQNQVKRVVQFPDANQFLAQPFQEKLRGIVGFAT